MTRTTTRRVSAVLALALCFASGLTACGPISTLTEGWKYAKAVEADLEDATGVKPDVGFRWQNGQLLMVTVAYPQLYEKQSLPALAAIVRRSVESHFKQRPGDIVLSFSLGPSSGGSAAQWERNGRQMASNEE